MRTLGDRIKQQRQRRGLTQEEVSRLAQYPRPRIAELETNKRFTVSSLVLRRLAIALSCTTDFLVGMHEQDSEHAA
jgi:transcriptional regulator with XRE-family HTH domain